MEDTMCSLKGYRHADSTGGPDRQIQFEHISEFPERLAAIWRKGPFGLLLLYKQDETGCWDLIPFPTTGPDIPSDVFAELERHGPEAIRAILSSGQVDLRREAAVFLLSNREPADQPKRYQLEEWLAWKAGAAAHQRQGISRTTVFIGHGASPIWRELKAFLSERLTLHVEEFNSVSAVGLPTIARLTEMLDAAAFAFLIMTAEDETPDGKFHARLNVVHETGLFQGRLGFKKAIVLLEERCEEFSNIKGLGQIRFPTRNISAKFEEIRLVLEREKIIASS
jgi:predicted nucleotide-binding protein